MSVTCSASMTHTSLAHTHRAAELHMCPRGVSPLMTSTHETHFNCSTQISICSFRAHQWWRELCLHFLGTSMIVSAAVLQWELLVFLPSPGRDALIIGAFISGLDLLMRKSWLPVAPTAQDGPWGRKRLNKEGTDGKDREVSFLHSAQIRDRELQSKKN